MTTEQRLADLERQVAELNASLTRVAQQAAVVWTFGEMFFDSPAGLSAAPPRRPRHLHAVNGSAS